MCRWSGLVALAVGRLGIGVRRGPGSDRGGFDQVTSVGALWLRDHDGSCGPGGRIEGVVLRDGLELGPEGRQDVLKNALPTR